MTLLLYICNCKMGFVSNHLKAFKLQNIVQAPMSATASSNYYLDQRFYMRVRKICCLNNLGTMPLNSRKYLWNKHNTPFPRQHNSPKRKGGNKLVTGRKARGLQTEEIGCKCQTFFLSLKQQEETNYKCQGFFFFSFSIQN